LILRGVDSDTVLSRQLGVDKQLGVDGDVVEWCIGYSDGIV